MLFSIDSTRQLIGIVLLFFLIILLVFFMGHKLGYNSFRGFDFDIQKHVYIERINSLLPALDNSNKGNNKLVSTEILKLIENDLDILNDLFKLSPPNQPDCLLINQLNQKIREISAPDKSVKLIELQNRINLLSC